jgi:hypothetical protein
MARLNAYKLVAKTGAITKKPDSAPANNQKWLLATTTMAIPIALMAMPCMMLAQPALAMSRHAMTNQIKGCIMPTVRIFGASFGKGEVGMAVGCGV